MLPALFGRCIKAGIYRGASNVATLFHGIENLYTFAGVAKKDGRHVQESDLTLCHDGVILERDGYVLWAGEKRKLTKDWLKKLLGGGDKKRAGKKSSALKKVNLNAKTVLPAFIECHTHSIFAGDRRNEFEMRNQGKTYQEITAAGGGILSTVKATRAAKDAELIRLTQERAHKFAKQGITVLEIKSGYGLNHEQELRLLKLLKKIKGPRIAPTFLGLHSKSPDHPDLAAYVDDVIGRTLPEVHKQKLAKRVDIFVEKGFFTQDDAKRLIEKAKSYQMDLTVHADQLTRTGAGVQFAQVGAVSCDHLVQISEADIRELAASRSTCVLLPASDLYMKMAYPPARPLIDKGARVALSTDFNPGTSPTQDLSLVGVLARLEMKMSLAEVFSAFTFGAASALGMGQELGSLEHNKCCDFIVSDKNLIDFFYEVGEHPVKAVYQSGKSLKFS
jgi:imidazolonepropionase